MKRSKKISVHDVTEGLYYQPEEVLETSSDQKQNNFLGVFVDPKKINIIVAIICLSFLVVIGKAVYLQIFNGDTYYAKAEGNRSYIEYIEADRGLIYDAQGRALVHNEPNFEITLTPSQLPYRLSEREDALKEISDIIEIDQIALSEIVLSYSSNHSQPIVIRERVSYEDALQYMTVFSHYPSLDISISNKRIYTQGGFSHILGYTGKISGPELEQNKDKGYLLKDFIGKSGLEKEYESVLRGKHGQREIEVNATGSLKNVLSEIPAKNGKSVQLHIDQELQEYIFELTQNHLRKIGKSKASVIVMNPNNGAVLSLVSYPEFDNNLFSGGISFDDYSRYIEDPDNPLFNRSITGEYPSGSTIKIIVGGAALEENVITEKTGFMSTGGILILDKWFFPDWRAGGHGYTTIVEAIADSVNTFFYIVGGGYEDFKGLGLDILVEYYKRFGLGEETGIDLPVEADGLVPTREWKREKKQEEWYIGDTYHLAIGQGDVLVTPLQVAQYTTVFANKGSLYAPQIVDTVIDQENIKIDIPPKIISDDIIGDYPISVIRRGMRAAVEYGSAQYLSTLPVTSAGKTGTAQFSKIKDPHAWFTGFAPYENPEIVVTVLIEEGEEGSSAAVPLARDIMEYYFGEYQQQGPDIQNE